MSGSNSSTDNALPPAASTIFCPECKREIPQVIHARAAIVVCQACSKIFLNTPKGLANGKAFYDPEKVAPYIPVGSKGVINGVKYAVMGFQVQKEKRKIYRWREYTLFNPVYGFAFLAEYDGHWNFFQFTGFIKHSTQIEKSIDYDGDLYKLYHRYREQTVYAQGEFPWEFRNSEDQIFEYVAPPYILNKITNPKEISWLEGEYKQPEEIQQIFGLSNPLPAKVGVGSSEPCSVFLPKQKLFRLGYLTFGILLFLHILFTTVSSTSEVFYRDFAVPPTANETTSEPIPGPTFTLKPDNFGTTNIEIKLRAPVYNDWFATGITLIHQSTGKEFDFELGVESYEGLQSTSISEDEKMISGLEPGKYQMLVYPYNGKYSNLDIFSISVKEDVPITSNFLLIGLLLLLAPLAQHIRNYFFEMERWSNSDYAP